MLPMPTTPSVFPASSRPWNFFFSHLPPLTLAVAWATCRASATMWARVSSATVVDEPPGVFMTTTPRRVAASMSTLSTPTPARPITFRRVARSSSRAVTFVALRTASPSYSGMICSSASGLSPSFTSTWRPAAFRISTPSGERSSETRTRATIGAPSSGLCGVGTRESPGNGSAKSRGQWDAYRTWLRWA